MSAPVPVGVIGVGAFGERHVAAYACAPGASLVGVADRDRARAEAVAERWGVPAAFADERELLDSCDLAGVSIATPGQHHLQAALAALERGCAVLLEKPVTMSAAEARELREAEERSCAHVVPAHILRFADPYIALRDRVRRGAVGEVLAISAARDRPRSHERLFPGVDPALMTTVHDIDLALWISGSRAQRVSARGGGAQDGVPLVSWAQVEAADGSIWSLRSSWVLPETAEPADRIEVYGRAGVAALALEPTMLTGALDAEVRHFVDTVRARRRSSVVSLAEAAHGIAIAEAVIASRAAGGAWTAVEG